MLRCLPRFATPNYWGHQPTIPRTSCSCREKSIQLGSFVHSGTANDAVTPQIKVQAAPAKRSYDLQFEAPGTKFLCCYAADLHPPGITTNWHANQ